MIGQDDRTKTIQNFSSHGMVIKIQDFLNSENTNMSHETSTLHWLLRNLDLSTMLVKNVLYLLIMLSKISDRSCWHAVIHTLNMFKMYPIS